MREGPSYLGSPVPLRLLFPFLAAVSDTLYVYLQEDPQLPSSSTTSNIPSIPSAAAATSSSSSSPAAATAAAAAAAAAAVSPTAPELRVYLSELYGQLWDVCYLHRNLQLDVRIIYNTTGTDAAAVLVSSEIDAAIFSLDWRSVASHGSPVDRIDVLILTTLPDLDPAGGSAALLDSPRAAVQTLVAALPADVTILLVDAPSWVHEAIAPRKSLATDMAGAVRIVASRLA